MAEFNVGTTTDINSWLNGETSSQVDSSQEPQIIESQNTVVDKLLSEAGGTPPVVEGKEPTSNNSVDHLLEDSKTPEKEDLQYDSLYSTLLENNIAIPLEDNYTPTTKEELLDALSQSIDYKTSERVNTLWEEKLNNLPESLFRIFQYAEEGVTTADQILKYTQSVSQAEQIASLDLDNEEDQEKIVLLQFLNSGTPKDFVDSFIQDLKDKDKLHEQASKIYPTLKQAYMEQMQSMEKQKRQEWEQIKSWMDANSANVHYFLDEKNQDYIPFKISSNKEKNDIVALAAQPLTVRENGDIVYNWEERIKNLQNGDEKSYKQFMKIMTFLSNPSKYEESLSKATLNLDKEKKFKKIVTTPTSTQKPSTNIPQQQNTGKWSVR